jgi:hypothetical protein
VDVVKKVKGVFNVRDADVYIEAPVAVLDLAPPPPPDAPIHSESDAHDPAAPTGAAPPDRRPADAPAPASLVVLRPPLPAAELHTTRTTTAVPPADGLAAAVEQVRQSDSRFRGVDCRLDGDAAVLRAGAGRAEDVMAFARAIAHLPGLTRIVIRTEDDAP